METIIQRKLFKLFYYLAKLNGLAPFSYTLINNNQNIQIFSSKFIAFYSISVNCLLITALIISLIIILNDIPNFFQKSFLFRLVLTVENLNFIIKCLINGCVHIIYRKQLISLINEIISLSNTIMKMEFYSKQNQFFENNTFMHKIYLQICLILIQLFALICPMVAVVFYAKKRTNSTALLFSWLFIIYMHGISSIIVNSTFYFGIMLMNLYLFTIINVETENVQCLLLLSMNKNRKQNQCTTISDRIDNLTIIYMHVSECCKKVKEFFQIQLIYNLFGAFFVITIELFFTILSVMTNDFNRMKEFQELTDIGFIVFFLIDLFTIIGISENVTNEARYSGELIHDVFILNDLADVRLKKGVYIQFFYLN